jgi:hypothetical protein
VNVHPSTIIRVLKKEGVRPRRAARKLFLSDRHAQMRLAFADRFGDRDREWWPDVIFSDEKSFG